MQERRLHRLFRTRNTDYFLRHRECVGVRDRATGCWLRGHAALRTFAVELPDDDDEDAEAWLGRRLTFCERGEELVTSPIEAIERPSLHTVVYYVSHARAGTIEIEAAA